MCTFSQISCTSAKPQECGSAAAGRPLVRLYLGGDSMAGFGCCCMCEDIPVITLFSILSCLAQVFQDERIHRFLVLCLSCCFPPSDLKSHVDVCQAFPGSLFFVKKKTVSTDRLIMCEMQGIIDPLDKLRYNRQTDKNCWLRVLSPYQINEKLNHNALGSYLNCNTLFYLFEEIS